MQNSSVFFLITIFSFPTYAAEQKPPYIDNKTIAIEPFLRSYILIEPHASHPGNNWNIGLGTDMIAALHCVNKLFDKLCNSLIDAPRKKIVKQYEELFTIKEKSVLFNQYGQWAGIGYEKKDPNSWCIFFGNESNIHCIKDQLTKNNTVPMRIIDSCSIEYHDEYGDKKNRPVFLIDDNMPSGKTLLIIPDEKKTFCLDLDNQRKSIPYFLFYRYLKNTTNLLLQRAFSLSEDSDFWSARYAYNNALSIERNINEHALITFNLSAMLFQDELSNSDTLCNYFNSQGVCICDTQCIDASCYKHYRDVLSIARRENQYNLVKKIHNHFTTYHIVHEIKDKTGTSCGLTYTLYTNALNDLLIKKGKNSPTVKLFFYILYHNSRGLWYPPSAPEIITSSCETEYKTMQDKAEEHSYAWQKMNNVIFYRSKNDNNTDRIHYAPLQEKIMQSGSINGYEFIIDKDSSIQSVHQFAYHKDKQSIIIFRIHNTLKNQYKLIYCMPFTGYYENEDNMVYKCNSLHAIQRHFNFLISKSSDGHHCNSMHTFTIEADKNDIDQMFLYLHSFEKHIVSLTVEPKYTKTLLQFEKISAIEYDYYKDKYIKFTPIHWLDKIWYGTSACSIYSAQNKYTNLIDRGNKFTMLSKPEGQFSLCLMLSICCAFCRHYYQLGILINTHINRYVYNSETVLTPIIYKTIWGSRIASLALFGAFGRSLFSNTLLRIGFTMLPIFNLGFHAYKMNRATETVNIPFQHLYNSWPAQLRRQGLNGIESSSVHLNFFEI